MSLLIWSKRQPHIDHKWHRAFVSFVSWTFTGYDLFHTTQRTSMGNWILVSSASESWQLLLPMTSCLPWRLATNWSILVTWFLLMNLWPEPVRVLEHETKSPQGQRSQRWQDSLETLWHGDWTSPYPLVLNWYLHKVSSSTSSAIVSFDGDDAKEAML